MFRTALTHNLDQVHHRAVVLKNTFGDNELSLERSTLPFSFLVDDFQLSLQVGHIVVVIPLDGTSRDLKSLLHRKVDRLVRYDYISSFGECWNDRGDGREGLGVDDDRFNADETCDIVLQLSMNV